MLQFQLSDSYENYTDVWRPSIRPLLQRAPDFTLVSLCTWVFQWCCGAAPCRRYASSWAQWFIGSLLNRAGGGGRIEGCTEIGWGAWLGIGACPVWWTGVWVCAGWCCAGTVCMCKWEKPCAVIARGGRGPPVAALIITEPTDVDWAGWVGVGVWLEEGAWPVRWMGSAMLAGWRVTGLVTRKHFSRCALSMLEKRKRWPQISQGYGFSPVCVRRCRFILGRLVKLFPQISHMNGFSPEEKQKNGREKWDLVSFTGNKASRATWAEGVLNVWCVENVWECLTTWV